MAFDPVRLYGAAVNEGHAGFLRALSTMVAEHGGVLLADPTTSMRRSEARLLLASAEGMGMTGPAPDGTNFASARRSRGANPFTRPRAYPKDIHLLAGGAPRPAWHDGYILPLLGDEPAAAPAAPAVDAPPPPPKPRWFLLFNEQDAAAEPIQFLNPNQRSYLAASAVYCNIRIGFRFGTNLNGASLAEEHSGIPGLRTHWQPSSGAYFPFHPNQLRHDDRTLALEPRYTWCLSSPLGALFTSSTHDLYSMCRANIAAHWFAHILDDLALRFEQDRDKLVDQDAMLGVLGITEDYVPAEITVTLPTGPPRVALPDATLKRIDNQFLAAVSAARQHIETRLADARADLAAAEAEAKAIGDISARDSAAMLAELARAKADGVITDFAISGDYLRVLFDNLVTSITEEDRELVRQYRGMNDHLFQLGLKNGVYKVPAAVLTTRWSCLGEDHTNIRMADDLNAPYNHPHNMAPPCVGHGTAQPINRAMLRRLMATDLYAWCQWWKTWLLTSNLEAGYEHVVARHARNGQATLIEEAPAIQLTPVTAAPDGTPKPAFRVRILRHTPPPEGADVGFPAPEDEPEEDYDDEGDGNDDGDGDYDGDGDDDDNGNDG